MSLPKIFAGGGLILLLATAPADANVVRIEITKTEPAGPAHEKISGVAYGELDPTDPKNAMITDIELAPRNARGKVEYIATFSLVKPVDMSKASGVLVYTVVNRGNGIATPNADGHVTLVSGWQGDLVPTATNQTIRVPVAKNPDGSSITGPLIVRFTDASGASILLTIPRNQPSPYLPASLDTTKATLLSATAESATGVKTGMVTIPGTDWAFADCSTTPFPGRQDPSRLCVKGGFNPALLYELRYTAKDPLVLGIGLAATRDLGSFFKYERQDSSGTPNPVAGRITAAISEGSSQSGTFLRLSLLLGFNQDERGRIVWDGMNPHIAARLTDLNRRFALPSGAVSLYELGHEGPVWWTPWSDSSHNRPQASLLDRCRATNTCPKIAETFGSAEVWNLRLSFNLVGTTAKADIPIPENVRRYYFPSVTHGGGRGGFSTSSSVGDGEECVCRPTPHPSHPCAPRFKNDSSPGSLTERRCRRASSRRWQLALLCRTCGRRQAFLRFPARLLPKVCRSRSLTTIWARASATPTNQECSPNILLSKARCRSSSSKVMPTVTKQQGSDLRCWRRRSAPTQDGMLAASGVFKGQSCGNLGGFIPFREAESRPSRRAGSAAVAGRAVSRS